MGKLKKRGHLYDLDVDGSLILKYLSLDRYRSRASVNAVMNLRAS